MQLRGTSADPAETGAQYSVTHPFAKGKAINLGVTPLGTGATSAADLVTANFAQLLMLWRIGNATTPATALGDLNGFIQAYEDDGSTVFAQSITTDLVVGAAALIGSVAYVARRYALTGIDKVKVSLVNNNVAGLQGATAIYYLQK